MGMPKIGDMVDDENGVRWIGPIWGYILRCRHGFARSKIGKNWLKWVEVARFGVILRQIVAKFID